MDNVLDKGKTKPPARELHDSKNRLSRLGHDVHYQTADAADYGKQPQ